MKNIHLQLRNLIGQIESAMIQHAVETHIKGHGLTCPAVSPDPKKMELHS